MENFRATYRKVNYKGVEAFLPVGFNWIATDKTGIVVAFKYEPYLNTPGYWECDDSYFELGLCNSMSIEESNNSKEYFPD